MNAKRKRQRRLRILIVVGITLLLAVLLVYLAAGGTSMLVLTAVTGLLHCTLCGSLLYHLYRIKA